MTSPISEEVVRELTLRELRESPSFEFIYHQNDNMTVYEFVAPPFPGGTEVEETPIPTLSSLRSEPPVPECPVVRERRILAQMNRPAPVEVELQNVRNRVTAHSDSLARLRNRLRSFPR